MPVIIHVQEIRGVSFFCLMGDLAALYLQLATSVSQILLWSAPTPPAVCHCQCETVEVGISESCATLVREVFSICTTTHTTSSFTTTSSLVQPSSNWPWLWIILIVFAIGCITGRFGSWIVGRFARAPSSPVSRSLAGGSTPVLTDGAVKQRRGLAA